MSSQSIENTFSNPTFGWILRGFQVIFTFLSLVLGSYALDKYSRGGGLGFYVAVTVLTFLYLIILIPISLLTASRSIIPGIILIIESFLTLLWFIAFIALAALYGGNDCDSSGYVYGYGYYRYYYYINENACRSTKALIAFGLFNFLLFTASSLSIGFYIVKPLISSNVSYWKTIGRSQVSVNGPVLYLTNSGAGVDGAGVNGTEQKTTVSDLETGVDEDQLQEPKEVVNNPDDNGIITPTTTEQPTGEPVNVDSNEPISAPSPAYVNDSTRPYP